MIRSAILEVCLTLLRYNGRRRPISSPKCIHTTDSFMIQILAIQWTVISTTWRTAMEESMLFWCGLHTQTLDRTIVISLITSDRCQADSMGCAMPLCSSRLEVFVCSGHTILGIKALGESPWVTKIPLRSFLNRRAVTDSTVTPWDLSQSLSGKLQRYVNAHLQWINIGLSVLWSPHQICLIH